MKNLSEESSQNPWPLFIVFMSTLLIFLPLCAHEFTWWDDWATVHQNPWLNPPTLASFKHYASSIAYGLYIPVTYFVWIALAYVGHVSAPDENNIALNPWVFHSANVCVHVISAVFVYLLLRQLVKREAPACFGALLFALHPVQVEPVGWISGMKDVLAGCLAIIALWRFVVRAQQQKNSKPDILGTIAFILAMLAKPSAVVVPIIAMGIDWLIIRKDFRKALRGTAIWFALTIPILIIARIAQDVTGIPKAPLWARPLIATDTLAFYLYKLFVPIGLAADYGRRPGVVIAQGSIAWTWIAPVMLTIFVIAFRKRFAWLGAAWFVFVASLLPVLGLATFQFQFTSTVADHYLYLAMLGPALALAFALRNANWKVGYPIATAWLIALGVRTSLLEPVWKDDVALFEHNLLVNSKSAVAYNNLGNAYKRNGDSDKALDYFQRAMTLAPDFPNAFNNAAFVLAERGDWRGAVDSWERSLNIRAQLPRTLFPNYTEDHNRIGQVLLAHGEYDRAAAHFRALLSENPNHIEAKEGLAKATRSQ